MPSLSIINALALPRRARSEHSRSPMALAPAMPSRWCSRHAHACKRSVQQRRPGLCPQHPAVSGSKTGSPVCPGKKATIQSRRPTPRCQSLLSSLGRPGRVTTSTLPRTSITYFCHRPLSTVSCQSAPGASDTAGVADPVPSLLYVGPQT